MPLWSNNTFSTMKLYLWGRIWRFILVNPRPLVWSIVIKAQFFITCNDTLEKWFIAVDMGFFISLTNNMSKLCVLFPTLFKWRQIIDWDVLRSNVNSCAFLWELYTTNSHKASLKRSDKSLGLTYEKNKTLKIIFGLYGQ